MKFLIKTVIITAFIGIVVWQVIGLAVTPSFDYTYYVRCVERIEDILDKPQRLTPSTMFSEAKLALMSDDKPEADNILNGLITEYEELKADSEQRQHALEKIAVLTYELGDYKKALKKAEEVLNEYPKSIEASTVLAMCYHKNATKYAQQRRFDLAISEYQKILEYPVANGLKAFANYFIGHVYEQKGDTNSAFSYYNNVISDYPELGWAKNAKERIEARE